MYANQLICIRYPSGVGSRLHEPRVTILTVHKLVVSDQETSGKLSDYVGLCMLAIVFILGDFSHYLVNGYRRQS